MTFFIRIKQFAIITLLLLPQASNGADFLPKTDRRAEISHTNRDFFTFHRYESKHEWLKRKQELRDNLRVAFGCYPWPEKTPLNAAIFDRIEGEGFTVDKAYFESLPGVYVTGNLYRPVGKEGPHPAVLCPHGHWEKGRLVNDDNNSVPARCINLARMGCVVLAVDMVGYADSQQFPHSFSGPGDWLWGLSLHGLQFWNSLRAVDFLLSLEDVDADRIGCTGASGGGTQTYSLTALDTRIGVSVPVNMLSSHFQGGCLCENAPSLRLDSFNVEFGAMTAPRPLLMIAATGDWTVETPRVEWPAVQSIYSLFDATEKVKVVQIDAPHNYNQQSREPVYAWFDRWFFGGDKNRIEETPIEIDIEALRVFPNGLEDYPDNALTEDELRLYWVKQSESQLQQAYPNSELELRTLKNRGATILSQAMNARVPQANDLVVERIEREITDTLMVEQIALGRSGEPERIDAWFAWPKDSDNTKDAVLIISDTRFESLDPETDSLLKDILDNGRAVMIANVYQSDSTKPTRAPEEVRHFYTYNPSDASLRVQDALTCLAYLDSRADVQGVSLVGLGKAGLWGLLAGVLHDNVDGIAVDAMQFDLHSDDAYLNQLFVPHIRRAGGLRMAQAAIAPRPLLIHNTGESFDTQWASDAYKTMNASDALQTHQQPASNEDLVNWVVSH